MILDLVDVHGVGFVIFITAAMEVSTIPLNFEKTFLVNTMDFCTFSRSSQSPGSTA